MPDGDATQVAWGTVQPSCIHSSAPPPAAAKGLDGDEAMRVLGLSSSSLAGIESKLEELSMDPGRLWVVHRKVGLVQGGMHVQAGWWQGGQLRRVRLAAAPLLLLSGQAGILRRVRLAAASHPRCCRRPPGEKPYSKLRPTKANRAWSW